MLEKLFINIIIKDDYSLIKNTVIQEASNPKKERVNVRLNNKKLSRFLSHLNKEICYK